MRRLFIAGKHMSAIPGLTLPLAPHQHFDPALEGGDVIGLGRDDAAQIIDDALEMGDFFFQMFHAPACGPAARAGQGQPCPALPPMRPWARA